MNTTAGNRNTDSMKLSYEEWSKQQQEYNNPTFDNATYTGLGGQSSDNLVSKDGSGTKEQGTFIRHFCEWMFISMVHGEQNKNIFTNVHHMYMYIWKIK